MIDTATYLLTGTDPPPRGRDGGPGAVDDRRRLVEAAVRAHGGVPSETGDGILAVFATSADAVNAALSAQRSAAAASRPDGSSRPDGADGPAARPRMAIDTSEVRRPDDHETAASRCARLLGLAHGGQILLSETTAGLVGGALPDGAWLVDLGIHRPWDRAGTDRLFELRHRDLPGGPVPGRPPSSNLPAQLTSFVGRGAELSALQQLISERRLVTLTGPGGCGKTRLALQAATRLADRWPDGVWWVDLGSITDPDLVGGLTASALRVLVEPASGPLHALRFQLRGRCLLVCLDTCEHVVDMCADVAATLLEADPGIQVLATSREPLGVPGETVWRVPPLAANEAVGLFTERAALVRPEFTATGDALDAVRAICRRVDGIPLAVELAAAWVRVLSPARIAAEMEQRFGLLTGAARKAVARHRTMAASMQWSHDLLTEADRLVFRRLAVFAGGFTLEAAQAVCAIDGTDDMLTSLGRLVDKSLVFASDANGETRYGLLDTVREYAFERLDAAGEAESARDEHLDHYLRFAELAEPELERDQDAWRRVVAREHDNLRAALGWGLEAAEPERGRRLAAALARFWFLHGHSPEGLGYLRHALDRDPEAVSPLQGRLLSAIAMLGLGTGQPVLSADAASSGLDIADRTDDMVTRARCVALASYGQFYGDFTTAGALGIEAQRYAEAAGDPFAADFGMLIEACSLTNADRHEEAVARARVLFERCLPRGERFCAMFARACEAYAALLTGDVRLADAIATEALRIAEPLGDYFAVGHAVSNLAWVKSVAGEVETGRRLMEPIVRSFQAAPGVELPIMALSPARLDLAAGDLASAVGWFEQATRFATPTPDNWVVARALPGLAGALRRMGRAEEANRHAERGLAVARALDVPHAQAEALDELALLVAPDDPARSEDLHHEALALRVRHNLRTFTVDSLEALAGLAAGVDSFDRAARLLAAGDAGRSLVGYPRPVVDRPGHDAVVAATRAALGEDAFADAWTQGAALSLDEAVAYATRARGPRGRPARGWASLTPTEREIVQLVTAGLSNPQIGARLFISRATVKTHLSHVYAKLNVGNRAELAALASAHQSASS